MRAKVLLVSLLVICTSACAQRCITSSAPELSAALQRFPLCSNYVGSTTIFLPVFGFPSFIVDGMNAIVRILGTKIPDSPTIPPVCADQALQYFCSFLFRPCSAQNLPHPLCRASCQAFNPLCRFAVSAVLTAINQTASEPLILPDCTTAVESGLAATGSGPEITGQPVFPDAVQTWNVSANGSNMLVNVSCNSPVLISPIPNFGCFGAWRKNPNTTVSYCELMCPIVFISRRATYIGKTLMLIFGILGFVLGIITFTLRLAVPAHRQYPSRLVLYCLAVVSWGGLWFTIPFWRKGGWWNFVCHKGDLSRRADAVFDAIFTYYVDLSFALYWAAISVHTLIAVKIGNHVFNWKTEVATHCICLGIPILFACIAAGKRYLGGTPFTPWGGFLPATPDDIWSDWPVYPLYWAPILIANFVSIGSVFYVIIASMRKQLKGNRVQWKRNVRIFAFIGIFIIVESFKLSYRFRVTARTKQLFASLTSYVNNSVVDPHAPRGEHLHDGEVILFLAVLVASPLLVSILFLFNPDIKTHWMETLANNSNPFTSSATSSKSRPSAEGTASSLMES